MRNLFAIVIALIVGAIAGAQDADIIATLQKMNPRVFDAESSDAKLRWESIKKLREDVNKKDVEAWRSIKTKADWERLRDEKVALLRKSLGQFPDAPKSVKVVVTKKIEGEGYTIENIIYESRPGFYVTANLYVPAGDAKNDKQHPGFIVVHSHHNPKTQGELQDMGILWAKQGCMVLVPDMLGHGERRQHPFVDAKSYPEKYEVGRQDYRFRYNNALQLHLVGESLVGWMVWDLMRGVDVLYLRPNIDKSKIMVFGSVAGGGDPCAVFAALDPRVTASAPFNFGGPQPETGKLGEDAELAFNYMGGGSWESTRNLKVSAKDGFLPWLIVGSIAPRGLVYGHEFAWDKDRDPVWKRFNTIWGFYDAKDKLASSHGRGSVRGMAPDSTHCNNIGFEHRKPIYPTLTTWFGLPIPEENKKRYLSSELQCWTDQARTELKPKTMLEVIRGREGGGSKSEAQENWLRLLGVSALPTGNCKVEEVATWDPKMDVGFSLTKCVYRHDSNVAIPVVIMKPNGVKNPPVVIGLAQEGKAGFFKHRAETIYELLKSGVAVALPDLRGTGETAADGRGRQSGGTSYSASLLMHGQTVPGVQLQELVLLMRELPKQGFSNIALWGDSFAEPNNEDSVFAKPYDVSNMPRQSEPMGGTLALLGGLFGGENVKAIYVRGGMVSFRSMLDSTFCYFPHDAVIPGVLPSNDLPTLADANAKRGLRMEGLVDGLNRRVDDKTLKAAYKAAMFSRPAHDLMTLRSEPATPAEVAAWLAGRLRK